MLTFFRRIRKGLLDGGATRKYLLYAVGEIALVVIGILIALQINNWNEEQKRKKIEIELLKGLGNEMLENIRLLEESIEVHLIADTIAANLVHNWEELNDDEIIRNFWNLSSYCTTDLISGVVNSIKTGNGLSIISNETIRNFVTSWEDKVNDIYENEELEAHLVHDFLWPLMYGNMSLNIINKYVNQETERKITLKAKSKIVEEISVLVHKNEFQGLLLQREDNRRWVLEEIRLLKN